MIKKLLKISFKFILVAFVLVAISYGGFHLWEYATGGKYVNFLSKNSETIPIEKSFSFERMEQDIANNHLILVGEIHGFHEPSVFDVDFFKYLHENHNVNHYIAELDFVQAQLLNDFLYSGEEKLLQRILENWAVIQGRNNKDYFEKYIQLQQYFQQLPENEKFKFVGIDRIQDENLVKEYLNSFYPSDSWGNKVEKDGSTLNETIEELTTIYSQNTDTLFLLSHLKKNAEYILNKENREEIMFQNFHSLFSYNKWSESKLYGFFGLYHVFQYRINNSHPLASKIRKSNLGLENKILSINFMMNDSYMVMPSNQLPEFMREKGAYTRIPVSADNMLFMYIIGVKDFKRMTPQHHKSLIKMDTPNSPYINSMRLSKTIQLLPVTDQFKMNDEGLPYVQYTVFVRNSDWAAPMK